MNLLKDQKEYILASEVIDQVENNPNINKQEKDNFVKNNCIELLQVVEQELRRFGLNPFIDEMCSKNYDLDPGMGESRFNQLKENNLQKAAKRAYAKIRDPFKQFINHDFDDDSQSKHLETKDGYYDRNTRKRRHREKKKRFSDLVNTIPDSTCSAFIQRGLRSSFYSEVKFQALHLEYQYLLRNGDRISLRYSDCSNRLVLGNFWLKKQKKEEGLTELRRVLSPKQFRLIRTKSRNEDEKLDSLFTLNKLTIKKFSSEKKSPSQSSFFSSPNLKKSKSKQDYLLFAPARKGEPSSSKRPDPRAKLEVLFDSVSFTGKKRNVFGRESQLPIFDEFECDGESTRYTSNYENNPDIYIDLSAKKTKIERNSRRSIDFDDTGFRLSCISSGVKK